MSITRLNPTRALSLKDAAANRDITAQYSGTGVDATDWACMWDGYKIAAVSTPKAVRKGVLYTSFNVGSVTIPNVGYTEITSKIPSDVKAAMDANGSMPLSAMVSTWSTNTGAFSVLWLANRNLYVVGAPGVQLTGLNLRLLYLQ